MELIADPILRDTVQQAILVQVEARFRWVCGSAGCSLRPVTGNETDVHDIQHDSWSLSGMRHVAFLEGGANVFTLLPRPCSLIC